MVKGQTVIIAYCILMVSCLHSEYRFEIGQQYGDTTYQLESHSCTCTSIQQLCTWLVSLGMQNHLEHINKSTTSIHKYSQDMQIIFMSPSY